jgi:hypothetical protein
MSERQQVTAVRVANVPPDEFETAVESEDPPTVTALADMGKRSREPAPSAPGQGGIWKRGGSKVGAPPFLMSGTLAPGQGGIG